MTTFAIMKAAWAREDLTPAALALGFTQAELNAAFEYTHRKLHFCEPPGYLDGEDELFIASERTSVVEAIRRPTRAHRLVEMRAACTLEHCAELHGADDLTRVRALAVAYDRHLGGTTIDRLTPLLDRLRSPERSTTPQNDQ